MALDLADLSPLAESYASRQPQDILALALSEFSPEIGIAFSGAEDVVLIDMAAKIGVPFSVFSLDTGRLHAETYQFIEKVRTHYGIVIERVLRSRTPCRRWCARRGCSRSTRTGTRSAAASARSSR